MFEHVTSSRECCAQLTHSELDMAILGQLAACTNTSAAVSTSSHHKGTEQIKAYTSFNHQGIPVCCKMFLEEKRLKNLTKSLKENGLLPCTHGNAGRLPRHTLSISSTKFVVRFLLNYAEQHTIVLPGRLPGYSRSDVQLLPSSTSKRAVWRVYRAAVEAVSRSILWYTPLPVICGGR